ncbi:MAG TPA: hypothetical protein VGI20_04715 [Rhizomicrobium sp.]|jgi:hypothetical protein
MEVVIVARLFAGFGHHGGLRHGNLAGLHILGTLLMIVATVVLAAAATAGMSEWVGRRYGNENSTKAAAWITFLIVFVALGWVTLRVL